MGKLTISKLFELQREGEAVELCWLSKRYVSRIGDAYHIVDCPVCGIEMHLYPWSVAGTGKKCENKSCETAFFGGSRCLSKKTKFTEQLHKEHMEKYHGQ